MNETVISSLMPVISSGAMYAFTVAQSGFQYGLLRTLGSKSIVRSAGDDFSGIGTMVLGSSVHWKLVSWMMVDSERPAYGHHIRAQL